MDYRFVYGSYPTIKEASEAAEGLSNKGIPSDGITLVGDNPELSDENSIFDSVNPTNVGGTGIGGETDFWTSIAGLFGTNTSGNRPAEVNDPDMEEYRNSINNKEVLVMVDRKYEDKIQ